MADNDTADNERQAKLLAARRKLKKFQNKKTHKDTEGSSRIMSQDQVGVLFTDHGTPLAKKSDGSSVEVDTPFFMPSPPHAAAVLPISPTQPTNDSTERIQTLERENAALAEQYRQAQTIAHQEKNESETKLVEATAILTQVRQEHDNQLQTINDSHRQKMGVLEKINQDHQYQINILHKSNDEQQQRIDALQKTNDEQQQQIDALQKTNDDHQQHIGTLQASNDDFHTEINRLIDMVSELEEELAGTQAANYTKECEIKSLQTALHDLGTLASTKGLVDRLDTVTHERDALRAKIQHMEQDQICLDHNKQQQQNINDIQEQHDTAIKDLQEQHDTAIKELQEQHDTAIKELQDQHNTAIADLRHTITAQESQLTTAISSSETKEQGLGVLMDSVQHLERARSTLKDQLESKDQFIKRLEHLIETKDKDLETATTNLAQLEHQYAAIKQNLDEKEAAYTDLLGMKHDAQVERIERIQAKIKHVSSMYDRIESAANKVPQYHHERISAVMEQQHHEWESKIETLKSDLINARNAWRAEQAKVASLTQDLYHFQKRWASHEHGYEWIHGPGQSPFIGPLPPLVKPAFSEFLETPRCSGCQCDAIDI